jgi:subtilisin family serine protease
MDPRLAEIVETAAAEALVPVVIRLRDGAVPPQVVQVVARFGNVITARVPLSQIASVRADEGTESMKAATPIFAEPYLASAEEPSPMPNERPVVPAGVTGRGVVVGVVDWGVDFRHPDFRNPDGTTRLLAIWDQRSRARVTPPEPYGYGHVHTRASIDAALRSAQPTHTLGYDPADADASNSGTHGTHTLGIAAGNGRAGGPMGVAPDADLVFVHLADFVQNDARLPRLVPRERALHLADSVTLLEAIDFILRTADGRPCVINMSLGAHAGPHDGTTLVERALDNAVSERPGRAIVQSVGNYFDKRIHTSAGVRPGDEKALHVEVDPLDTTPNEIDIWYSERDRFSVEVVSPAGDTSPRVAPGEGGLLQVGGVDLVRIQHRRREPNSGDNNIRIVLAAGAPSGTWEIRLRGEDIVNGRIDAWIERDDVNRNSQARFRVSDDDTASTSGTICNGYRTIAVGAYDLHGAFQLAHFSSSGPTRGAPRNKPDIVAPGVDILSARSGASGVTDRYVRKSGTSMASPCVAGSVALMFEAAPRPLAIHETRALLLHAASPAPAGTPPARVGAGLLDIVAAVAAARTVPAAVAQAASEASLSPQAMVSETRSLPRESFGVAESQRAYPAMNDGIARLVAAPAWDSLMTRLAFEEAAGLRPARVLVDNALEVVGRPGERLSDELRAGDVMLRRIDGGRMHTAIIEETALLPRAALAVHRPAEQREDGYYAYVRDSGGAAESVARLFTGREGYIPRDQVVVRPRLRLVDTSDSRLESRAQETTTAGLGARNPCHPENCVTYEEWIATFPALTAFSPIDGLMNDPASTQSTNAGIRVLGDVPADRLHDPRPNQRAGEAPYRVGSAGPGEHFIDHPTLAWVNANLPPELISMAFGLGADCADVSVVLRHAWLFARGRSQEFLGVTCGFGAGRDIAHRRARVHVALSAVQSVDAWRTVNAYSDAAGHPIRSAALLRRMLHPGDLLVWEHRDAHGRRTGGHVQTVESLGANSLSALQGNQPLFAPQADAILRAFGANHALRAAVTGGSTPSQQSLRDTPGNRIERMSVPLEADDQGVWKWGSETFLIAAGPAASMPGAMDAHPPRGGNAPHDPSRGAQILGSSASWEQRLHHANNFPTLLAQLEMGLLAARAEIDRDLGQAAQTFTEAQATRLGQSAYARVAALARGADAAVMRARLAELRGMVRAVATGSSTTPLLGATGRYSATFSRVEDELDPELARETGSASLSASLAPTRDTVSPALMSATDLQSAEAAMRAAGTALFRAAVAAQPLADDRPLYWARLSGTRALLDARPPSFSLSIADRQRLDDAFEEASRGFRDPMFEPGATRRILVTGFDPFSFPSASSLRDATSGAAARAARDARTNLSASLALALDGATVPVAGGTARIRSVVLPVRFAFFDAGHVERLLRALLASPAAPDAILTLSLDPGTTTSVFIEHWAARARGTHLADNAELQADPAASSEVMDPPSVGAGPQFLASTLPPSVAATGTSGALVPRTSGTTTITPSVRSSFRTDARAEPSSSTVDATRLTGERAIAGSGGNFLSNEIFYRTRLLAGTTVRGGHVHVPDRAVGDAARSAVLDVIRDLLGRV